MERGTRLPIVTQDDNTDVVGFQVKRHTSNSTGEFHHFSGLDLGETEDSGNTVTNWDDSTEFLDVVLEILRLAREFCWESYELSDFWNFFLQDNGSLTDGELLAVGVGVVEFGDAWVAEDAGDWLEASGLGEETLEVFDHGSFGTLILFKDY